MNEEYINLKTDLSEIKEKLDKLLQAQLMREEQKREEDSKGYLGVVELADLCLVTQRTIYRWISTDQIPYHKIGNRILFSEMEIREFISSKREKDRRS